MESLKVVASQGPRQAGRLDWPAQVQPQLPGVRPQAARIWLAGGEPTLRADLPRWLEALAPAGLITDGLALARPQTVLGLVKHGLVAARIQLHSAVPAAHDWLVGRPGAHRLARAALRACAGIEVQGSVVLTRPTAHHLPQTVALLHALGARTIRVRLLHRRGPAAGEWTALAPNLTRLEPYLLDAVNTGADVRFEGIPRCTAPGVPADRFVDPEPWFGPAPATVAASHHCAGCTCGGLPDEQVALFGLPRRWPKGVSLG